MLIKPNWCDRRLCATVLYCVLMFVPLGVNSAAVARQQTDGGINLEICGGFAAQPVEQKKEEKAMEKKDIRQAVLRMIDANPTLFGEQCRKAVMESELVVRDDLDGFIDLGNFRSDLSQKTFAYITSPNAIISGRFVLNERGEWVGKITNSIRK
jgi:hypothetical protein